MVQRGSCPTLTTALKCIAKRRGAFSRSLADSLVPLERIVKHAGIKEDVFVHLHVIQREVAISTKFETRIWRPALLCKSRARKKTSETGVAFESLKNYRLI